MLDMIDERRPSVGPRSARMSMACTTSRCDRSSSEMIQSRTSSVT